MSHYQSVWEALEETPQEVQLIRLRAPLMQTIEQHVRGMSQPLSAVAAGLHIPENRLAEILEGSIDDFSLDELAETAAGPGLHLSIDVREAA